MKAGRIRLIVAAALMIGWLGYLAYLAILQPKPVVVSRAQLLHATHFVKVEVSVDTSNKPVTTVKVLESFGGNRLVEADIAVDNLAEARLPDGKSLSAGTYFMPLVLIVAPNQFRVVSPSGGEAAHLIVYPWTSEVEKQVKELVR